MNLFDTHCHIDCEAYALDRAEVLRRTREAGVSALLVPAIQASDWDALLVLCSQEQGLYPALGLHPVFLEQHQEHDLNVLESRLGDSQIVAIGEIGLDYYLPNLDRKEQQDYFERQLAMAKAADMPVVIHARKSHDDIITLLEKLRVPCGTIHAFNGSLQQAQKYIDLGFKLGFGGTLTFERSSKIRALAKALPLDSIVLETDAPDMTVSQHQGERNSPEYLPYCFQALSEIRDESPEEIATQLFKNSCEVFRIQGLVS